MVEYASGSIRFDGLGSDTNFSEMITKLSQIEMRQANQLIRWRNDWQIRLDAFKELRGELMNLQTAITGLNTMTKFMEKPATSSKDTVAVATAEADCSNQTYNVEVDELAYTYIWSKETGLHNKTDTICNGPDAGTFSYSYKGKTRTISVPVGTTVDGLKTLINKDSKNLGVRAQLLQRPDGISFQLQGKDTGKGSTLVIRDTTGLEGISVTLGDYKYADDAENRMELLNGFDADTDELLSSSATQNESFIYLVDDQRYTVSITPGMTIGELRDKINETHPGLARLESKLQPKAAPSDPDVYKLNFILEKADTTYAFTNNAELDTLLTEEFNSDGDFVNPTGAASDKVFSVTVTPSDGSTPYTKSVTATPGTTLRAVANGLQQQLGDTAEVKIVKVSSQPDKFQLQITDKPKVHRVHVENGSCDRLSYEMPTDPTWNIRPGQDARLRVDGYPADPEWLYMPSNNIKSGEIVDGLNLNLRGKGETAITVSTDTAKIKENIQTFVDAYNSFVTVLKKLTDYDEDKEVLDPEYAESQFEMQKGAVLTGNYGVQTVASKLKQAMSGRAPGFSPVLYDSTGGYISGDIFSTLSQIGITHCVDQGNSDYGKLLINQVPGYKGSKALDECLKEDPEAVARLFAAKDFGVSNSSYFSYNSHISSVTKAGTYQVSYSVDSSGKVVNATINGKEAKYDEQSRQLGLYLKDDPANGIVVDVSALQPGQTYTGEVSIQNGKVNEVLSMLEGSEGMLGTNGTLRTLEKNYQEIIEGIEAKIKKEDERLIKWKRTMTMKFSRLETVLGNYNNLSEAVKSQVSQLNTNSNK
ncbi:flagellar filament capping protein FliD [Desulfovibrio sp. OttesenSCG-928-A18]|nr:flagellar filament capping protein FliD [Desulfovibrio sp. OttesenSCG-928-A18]